MAETQLIYTDNPGTMPATFQLPPGLALALESVRAKIDGASASGAFFPCLSVYSQDGKLIARVPTGAAWAAGDSGEATWAPFLGEALGTVGVILNVVNFNPAANKIEVTSTNPANPTTIVTSDSVTVDGSTTVKLDFFAAAQDIDQRSKTGQAALLLELYRDSTALGVVSDFNVPPTLYMNIPVYVAALDTPAAGTYTYSIRGYKQVQGGTLGSAFIYGDHVGTAHSTRPGFLLITTAG